MTSSRHGELQPEDFKKLPIPNADAVEQAEISERVTRLLDLGEEFLTKRQSGWVIKTSESRVVAPPDLSKYPAVRKLPLRTAKVAWGLVIDDPAAHPATVYRRGEAFYRNRVQAAHFAAPVSEKAVLWIIRQFAAQAEDLSFQAAEAAGLEVPASPDAAAQALEGAHLTFVTRHPDDAIVPGKTVGWDDPGVVSLTRSADVLLNATPLGRREEMPLRPAALPKDGAVIDLVYVTGGTPLVRKARSLGLRTADGWGVLLWQGATAFELWTGKRAPLDAMRETLRP